MYQLAKYATATTIYFSMIKAGSNDLAQTADWTPATGDTKVSIDGATLANTTNNPAIVAGTNGVLWSLALTTGELTGADIRIQIVDSATKAVEDQSLTVYTYGNASAKFVSDFSVAALGALMPTTAGRTLDVTTTGEAGLDFANVNLPVGSIPIVNIIENGTMQAGSAAGTAVLRSATSFVDDLIIGATIIVTGGTGAGQSRIIYDWVSTTDTASISPNWATTPDNTSTYLVVPTPPAPTNAASLATTLISTGTGTGQVNLSSGAVPVTGDFTATMKTSIGTAVAASAVASVTGAVGSVTGAVGSVTGNVGGNVVGSVGSVAAGGITAASIATDAIDGDAIAASAVTEIQSGLATAAALDAVDNFLDTEIAAILALLDDPRTEPGQGAPPVNPDLATKIDYLYKAWRNRSTQTATTYSLYADDATTVDQKSTLSDDGTTFVKGEIATGP